MRATASWWNQGELECCIPRSAVPTDVAFTDAVCVYSIRASF